MTRATSRNIHVPVAYVQIHLHAAPAWTRSPYDNGADIFPGQGSRNLAVRCADADVVILHDADMVPPAAARTSGGRARPVVGPAGHRVQPVPAAVEGAHGRAFGGPTRSHSIPSTSLVDFSVGGCSPSHRSAGGRLAAWTSGTSTGAVRTSAFAGAAGAALGPVLRVDGPAVHLWHPHAGDPTNPDQQANSRLLAGGER